MRILLVTSIDPWTRSVSTIHRFVQTGRAMGHDIAIYGEPNPDLPLLPFTTELARVDLALFIVQVPSDFPDMPYLARVLDTVPRERRILIDLWGRFNDTIRVEHDFNHLEKLDGHLGWEWEEAFEAVSDIIAQPALAPRRPSVKSFLLHGFDPDSVVKPQTTVRDAVAEWARKPYGIMYVGSNWQRWTQVRSFLESYAGVGDKVGKACLVGWDWAARPDWAVQNGIVGVDTDPTLLAEAGVQTRDGVRFDEVVGLLGQARFAPVFHRPLFRELGLVTNRTFETFYADTLPVLMLPGEQVKALYGPAAGLLAPEGDVGAHLVEVVQRPHRYWEALLETRAYLARHHSYERRLHELVALSAPTARSGAAR